MILILNGSLGVGKTSVGAALQRKFNRSVHLDGDAIGDVHPFEIYDEKRVDQLYHALALLVGFYLQHGYVNFVINYVFESHTSLEALLALLRQLDPSIRVFWLTCDPKEQARRIRDRNGEALEWELRRFVELRRIQAEASKKGFIGKEVDTTALTPAQAAEAIWKDLKQRPPRSKRPRRSEGGRQP